MTSLINNLFELISLKNRGNVLGAKPYETGPPKCRNFGMSDSAKYPGLCKPYEVEQNAANEYAELAFNSINAQQNPSTYFTYKTYNTNYDNERMVGTSSSTRNNVQSSFPARPSYSTNKNNEVHSYNKRFDSRTTNQQQYGNQASYQPSSQLQQPQKQQQQQPPPPPPPPSRPPPPPPSPPTSLPSQPARYQMSPFQQAFTAYQQQQQQRRPIDRTNPFHTYRWDLLFKNYL